MIEERKLDYVRWQNRAFRFYVGARLLYLNEQYAPAAYCANQALELLLKATLVYWDKSFHPQGAGHNIEKMLRIFRNKVPGSENFQCPQYLFADSRYQSTSRYPHPTGQGLGVPASFLSDIDVLFFDLVKMVPFQHNTELKRALRETQGKTLSILRRKNSAVRSLRKYLGVRVSKRAPTTS